MIKSTFKLIFCNLFALYTIQSKTSTILLSGNFSEEIKSFCLFRRVRVRYRSVFWHPFAWLTSKIEMTNGDETKKDDQKLSTVHSGVVEIKKKFVKLHITKIWKKDPAKGQLISKCLLGVWQKYQQIFFQDFCPSL